MEKNIALLCIEIKAHTYPDLLLTNLLTTSHWIICDRLRDMTTTISKA